MTEKIAIQTEMVRTDQLVAGDTLVHRHRNGEPRPERSHVLSVETRPGRSGRYLRYTRPDGVETDGTFPAHLKFERVVTEQTATYTDEGCISVDGYPVGTFDADGGEWVQGVDEVLARHGFTRTGDWDGDNAPVVQQ